MHIANMTLAEQLRELSKFHGEARATALGEGGRVTNEASYHGQLADAAIRAAVMVEAIPAPRRK